MADPIKKATNGTYYFRANLGYDKITGKQKQKYKSGFKTKKEAREAYTKIMAQKNELNILENSPFAYQSDPLRTKHVFQVFFDEVFLPWYKTRVKDSTYRTRITSTATHFIQFSKQLIEAITPLDIQMWQIELINKGLSTSYVISSQAFLTLIFDRARTLGMIKNNPCKGVGNPRRTKKKIEFWTREEFTQVLNTFNFDDYVDTYMYSALWLLFMTGMRFGEAVALRWTDINFADRSVSISRNLSYYSRSDYSFSTPKTFSSSRTIYLDPTTLNILKHWQKVQAVVLGSTDNRDEQLILTCNGWPQARHWFTRTFYRQIKKAGVKKITVHGLRHSHAALLISMGENPLLIQQRLGHKDVETTLSIYGHLYPSATSSLSTRLDGILDASNKPPTEMIVASETATIDFKKNKQISLTTKHSSREKI